MSEHPTILIFHRWGEAKADLIQIIIWKYHILAVRLQEEHRILRLGSRLVLVIGLESGAPDVTGLQSADSDVTDIALHLTRQQERS
jgi:hypothetical protein